MKQFIYSIAFAALWFAATPAFAAGQAAWHLLPDQSAVVYGTIKQDHIGENNHFTGLSGSVTTDGQVSVDIDLMSVVTNIEVRDGRMRTYIFDAARPVASLKAQIDPAALETLAVGESAVLDVTGTLDFAALSLPIETKMFVTRLGENKVLAVSDELVMVTTDDLGIDAGVDKLKELAGLESITRVVPVMVRFVFEKD